MSLAKYQMFGLVRDKTTGKPKVDDPATLHPVQWGMMTKDERAELSDYTGSFARDAQGIKRVTINEDGTVTAGEKLVAVSEIFALPDDGSGANLVQLPARCDVAEGATIPGIAI